MPEPLIAAIRGTLAYFSLLILTRLMGKKQISQLTFFDYVVGITIGSIAASMSTDLQVGAAVHWSGLLVWTIWTLILGMITVQNRKWRKIIGGEPTVVVQNGQVLEGNLEQMNYTIDDLRMQLREKNAFDLSDVEFAILEPNGKLSVLKKSQKQPVTPSDLQISTDYKGVPVELVEDGQVLEENLQQIKVDRNWLEEQIRKRNHRLEEVYYAEIDTSGNLYVDLRDDLESIPVEQDISDA